MVSGNQAGTPVFSVHQTDVIYYGFTLPGYFRNEFRVPVPPDGLSSPKVRVAFWSDLVDSDGPDDWWNHRRPPQTPILDA
jgi:hypothetical protein